MPATIRSRWLRTMKERGRPWRPGGSRARASSEGRPARTPGSKRAGSQPGGEARNPVVLPPDSGLDGGAEPLHPVLVGGGKALLLAFEILMEGGTRDPGQFDDVGDLRVLVAVVGEGGSEAGEDAPALDRSHLGPRKP